MSCEDVANCIETDPNVRTAIASIVPAVPIDGFVYPPGEPLTPSQMTTPLNQIDACAFDPYWAQVEQYVDFMVNLGQDVLEQIAAYSTALDAGENIPMGKFLGKLKNSSTAGKVIEFLQWVLATVKAQYEAADNAANRDAIKCAIFCGSRDQCAITIQGTLDVLNERLGGVLTPADLIDLPTMVTAFTTLTFNPALALDLWLAFLMSSAKTAGMFGLEGIDETLQMVLAAAVNDANNDWVIKCDDCGEPPVEACDAINSTTPRGWVTNASDYGVMTATGMAGVLFVSDGQYYFRFRLPGGQIAGGITKYKLKFNQALANVTLYRGGTLASQIMGSIGATASDELIADATTHDPSVPYPYDNTVVWNLRVLGDVVPGSFRVDEVCVERDE